MPVLSKKLQNVLLGAGTVLELAPVRRMRSERRLAALHKKFSTSDDSAHIGKDWAIVGNDLRAAVESFAKAARTGE